MTKKTFREWYIKNRELLSQRRKERYRNDPEYRQKAIERASKRRASLRAVKPLRHGYSVKEVCDALGISLWTLNRWRKELYFPVVSLRGYRFNDNQVQLLGLLRDFFRVHPRRTLSSRRDELASLVSIIYHNWG